MNLKKIVLKTAIGLTVGLFTIATLILIINLFDEELNPEITAILQQPQNLKTVEQDPNHLKNGYVYLTGLNAPIDQEPIAFGQTVLNRSFELSRNANRTNADEEKLTRWIASQQTQLKGKLEVSAFQEPPYLSAYIAQRPQLEKLAADNQILLSRYRSLIQYQHFQEYPSAIFFFWAGSSFPQIHKLTLAQVGLHFSDGQLTEAFQLLNQDIAFWRMTLKESNQLITKMISIARLNLDFQLLSEMIAASSSLTQEQLAQLATLISPLTSSEKDISRILEHELRLMAPAIRQPWQMDQLSSLPEKIDYKLLFKPNATLNQFYAINQHYRPLMQAPAHQLIQKQVEMASALEQLSFSWQNSWRWAYNPFGKFIFTIGTPDWGRYPARVHNLDGLIRLVNLQLQVKAQQLSPADIPGFLARSERSLYNPYTEQPMSWDSQTNSLYFIPKTGRNEERIVIKLF